MVLIRQNQTDSGFTADALYGIRHYDYCVQSYSFRDREYCRYDRSDQPRCSRSGNRDAGITERSLAYIELNVVDTRKASYVLSDKIGIDNFKIVEDRIIRIYDGNISVQELSKALALHDVEMTAIGTKSESLEEYFLKLTGGDVRC